MAGEPPQSTDLHIKQVKNRLEVSSWRDNIYKHYNCYRRKQQAFDVSNTTYLHHQSWSSSDSWMYVKPMFTSIIITTTVMSVATKMPGRVYILYPHVLAYTWCNCRTIALNGTKPPINIWNGVLLYQGSCWISLGYLFVAEGTWNFDLRRCPINPPNASNGIATNTNKLRITRMEPNGSPAVTL